MNSIPTGTTPAPIPRVETETPIFGSCTQKLTEFVNQVWVAVMTVLQTILPCIFGEAKGSQLSQRVQHVSPQLMPNDRTEREQAVQRIVQQQQSPAQQQQPPQQANQEPGQQQPPQQVHQPEPSIQLEYYEGGHMFYLSNQEPGQQQPPQHAVHLPELNVVQYPPGQEQPAIAESDGQPLAHVDGQHQQGEQLPRLDVLQYPLDQQQPAHVDGQQQLDQGVLEYAEEGKNLNDDVPVERVLGDSEEHQLELTNNNSFIPMASWVSEQLRAGLTIDKRLDKEVIESIFTRGKQHYEAIRDDIQKRVEKKKQTGEVKTAQDLPLSAGNPKVSFKRILQLSGLNLAEKSTEKTVKEHVLNMAQAAQRNQASNLSLLYRPQTGRTIGLLAVYDPMSSADQKADIYVLEPSDRKVIKARSADSVSLVLGGETGNTGNIIIQVSLR